MNRGDILIGRFPHAANSEPKQRPVLVVQADYYNSRLRNVIVAAITSNLTRQQDPAHLLIDPATADGALSGLTQASLISCLNLAVLPVEQLGPRLGRLSPIHLEQLNQCLRNALGFV